LITNFKYFSFEMNGYGCHAPGNKLKKKYGGRLLSIQMLIFHVCKWCFTIISRYLRCYFFKEGVALGKTFCVVNSGGTSLIATITIEEHLGWGCYCDDSRNILRRKYGKNVSNQNLIPPNVLLMFHIF
jgi:hypothetical protein